MDLLKNIQNPQVEFVNAKLSGLSFEAVDLLFNPQKFGNWRQKGWAVGNSNLFEFFVNRSNPVPDVYQQSTVGL